MSPISNSTTKNNDIGLIEDSKRKPIDINADAPETDQGTAGTIITAIDDADIGLLHKRQKEAGANVERILKIQDDFENFIGNKLKRMIGPRKLRSLKEKIRTNRAISIQLSDIGLGLLSAPVLIPSSLAAAAAVYLEDPEMSAFFTQERVGKDDKDFNLYKLRSMFSDASRREFTSVPGKSDPRITKVGKILRATKVDEFLQWINIMKGQMSFVGPRPWLRKELETLPDALRIERQKHKPGLTSIASLRGNKLSLQERAELDVAFMSNMSLLGYYIMIASTVKNTGLSAVGLQDNGTFG